MHTIELLCRIVTVGCSFLWARSNFILSIIYYKLVTCTPHSSSLYLLYGVAFWHVTEYNIVPHGPSLPYALINPDSVQEMVVSFSNTLKINIASSFFVVGGDVCHQEEGLENA